MRTKYLATELRRNSRIILNGRKVVLDANPASTYGDNCYLSFWDYETKKDGEHSCSSKDEFEVW